MGIQGLLPLLKSIHKPCSLKEFSGKTLGVDAYGWLHRGTIACAIDLAQGKPTTKWLDFVMHRVRMLQHFGIVPYLVFDGDYLPSKSGTEKDRASRRKESKIKGLEMLRLGKTSLAQQELQKSIDVTPEMARQLIDELKMLNLPYVVAPYEADSQMAFLERQGIIDGIISEDSDLLVFGAQCLLTKLDQYGDCVMIKRDDFTACRDISLVGWSDADFRLMAILSGCDYLPSLEKMGLKTAYRLIRKHKTVDRIIKAVQFEGKIKVPPGYLDAFNKAEATFLYQWVYCSRNRCLVNFNHPEEHVDLAQFPCIGKHVEPALAIGVSTGDLHPHTKKPLLSMAAPRTFQRAAFRGPAQVRTPELKKHKSIETFFKPQRTPLAELDPNSFTPSPSQQRLLQRNPASWSAEPLRRPSLLSRTTSVTDGPTIYRPQRSLTGLPKASSKSPKRQRLCSDGYYASPTAETDNVEAGTSKFFKKSPKLQKGSTTSVDEFNLWSDDSVEQAMSQLADTTEKPDPPKKSSKRLSVFSDFDTPSKTVEPRKDAEETPFSAGLAAEMESLHTRFSYTGEKNKQQDEADTAVIPASSPSKDSKRKRNNDEHVIPCSSPVPSPIRHSPKPSRIEIQNEITEEDWAAVGAQPASGNTTQSSANNTQSSANNTQSSANNTQSSANTTQSSAQSSGISKACFSQGSEDLLVPDSEGDEEEIDECEDRRTSFSFDIKRFAFAG